MSNNEPWWKQEADRLGNEENKKINKSSDSHKEREKRKKKNLDENEFNEMLRFEEDGYKKSSSDSNNSTKKKNQP